MLEILCSVNDCDRTVFDGSTECVLHCEKKSYGHDFNNKGILRKFYDTLIVHIAELIYDHKSVDDIEIEHISKYLESPSYPHKIATLLEDTPIVFTSIFFPEYNDCDPFNYNKILKIIKQIHFNYCKFAAMLIELPSVQVFYQNCTFFQNWYISESLIIPNINNVLYQECIFSYKVTLCQEENNELPLDISLFSDCKFESDLSFSNAILNSPIFKNSDRVPVDINKLHIENCIMKDKFILNNLKNNGISIINSEFKSKFELKNGEIEQAEFDNTNFDGLFDCHSTLFGNFHCFKSIFNEFVGFEECKFGVFNSDNTEKFKAIFKYVTFLSFTNFRNSIFNQGLDLEHTNLKEPPNFLNIKLESDNTKRETYRIIKHSFDNIGNHIEANKFFPKEMAAYEQELRQVKKEITQEKIIFTINKLISNFGQSYIRPIVEIIIFAIIYGLVNWGHELNFLYTIYPPANSTISCISTIFNYVPKNIMPLKNFLVPGMEFISLIFYVIFSTLIWQTIVAIKRHTKR